MLQRLGSRDVQEPGNTAISPAREPPRPLPGACIGLLGGSFNPAHGGHLHISRAALRLLALDEVWWLVSPQNPLKAEQDMASLADRMWQAERTVDDRRIRVTDLESRFETRYTVDTVRALRGRYPRVRFLWLIGADNLAQMPRWYNWEALFHLVPIAVFARRPYSLKALTGPAAQRFARWRIPQRAARQLAGMKPPAWVFLDIRAHPASATAIREARERAVGPKSGERGNGV